MLYPRGMKRLILFALLAVTAPATAQSVPPGGEPAAAGRPARAYANPSALIAADMAFARLAQDKGQWTAFLETADEKAEMFENGRVLAKTALKGRANPPAAPKWQAHQVWISCDGSAGITHGAFQTGEGPTGDYATVWQRQKKAKDGYKWVLDDGALLPAPLAAPDWIEGKVADCPVRKDSADGAPPPDAKPKKIKPEDMPPRPLAGPIPPLTAPAGADSKDGQSRDGTLAWRSTVLPGGAREFTAWLWKDGAMREVVKRSFAGNGG